jgi:hypothetical protein
MTAKELSHPQQTCSEKAKSLWRDAARAVADGMNRDTFIALMYGLWEGMGRKAPPTSMQIHVWYSCLSDLTEAEFANAVREYLTTRSGEYISIQVIRELSGVQLNRQAAAIAAFDAAVAAIASVGSYATPQFEDPTIPAVIRHFGGWVHFCAKPTDELNRFIRPQFIKAYDSMNSNTSATASLTNLCDIENSRTGMGAIKKVVDRFIANNQQRRIDLVQQRRLEVQE